jgi:hypothetical protein
MKKTFVTASSSPLLIRNTTQCIAVNEAPAVMIGTQQKVVRMFNHTSDVHRLMPFTIGPSIEKNFHMGHIS